MDQSRKMKRVFIASHFLTKISVSAAATTLSGVRPRRISVADITTFHNSRRRLSETLTTQFDSKESNFLTKPDTKTYQLSVDASDTLEAIDTQTGCGPDENGGTVEYLPHSAEDLETIARDNVNDFVVLVDNHILKEEEDTSSRMVTETVHSIIETAVCIHPGWRRNIRGECRRIKKLYTLRRSDIRKYECHVFLKRPVRPDTFKLERSVDRLVAPELTRLHINERFSREEKSSSLTEWRDCVDSEGYLSPKRIDSWFARGLRLSCNYLRESSDRDVTFHVDGNGSFQIAIPVGSRGKEQNSDVHYMDECFILITVMPVFRGDGLPPSNLPIVTPFKPNTSQDLLRRRFLNGVKQDMEDGRCFWFLRGISHFTRALLEKTYMDPKLAPISPLSHPAPLWEVCLLPIEDRLFHFTCESLPHLNLQGVVNMFGVLRRHPDVSGRHMSRDLVRSALFWTVKEKLQLLKDPADTVQHTMSRLTDSLVKLRLPCFVLPRRNLLAFHHKMTPEILVFNLQNFYQIIKTNPVEFVPWLRVDKTSGDQMNGADDNTADR